MARLECAIIVPERSATVNQSAAERGVRPAAIGEFPASRYWPAKVASFTQNPD
jgi:hypothetical protein